MRRDSIFYKLFQQSPTLLFELLEEPPSNAEQYRFDCVVIKEPKFEIDGIFLPPDTGPGVVYFCEVQFQRDAGLYERLFGESLLYFYRNRSLFTDWQAVIIYPTRSTEQAETYPYRSLLNGNQVHRVFLDELGEIEQLPLEVALMVLTTVDEASTPEVARSLLERSQQEASQMSNQAIIEMLTTILVYKFKNLSRREAEEMIGISLQETRFYQEAKEEGREEGREEEGRELTLRLLTRRFGELSQSLVAQIRELSLNQVEALADVLFELQSLSDLELWLEHLPNWD